MASSLELFAAVAMAAVCSGGGPGFKWRVGCSRQRQSSDTSRTSSMTLGCRTETVGALSRFYARPLLSGTEVANC